MPSVQVGPSHLYSVSKHAISRSKRGSLVDRGANGGILGNDARVYLKHTREVDVTGIDNHELNALVIVDAPAKITTHKGPAIAVLRQYAYHGLGRTIHSCAQFEYYKNQVNDRSMKVGGTQCIKTNDGYIIPLDIINGLPYMKMHPNTDKEWDELPHILLTSSEEWDPRVVDHMLTDKEDWYNTLKELDDGIIKTPFDEFGNYRHREPTTEHRILPPITEDQEDTTDTQASLHEIFAAASNLNVQYVHDYSFDDHFNDIEAFETEIVQHDDGATSYEVVKPTVKKKPIDYEKYRPYFLHAPIDKIRQTFKVTTQHAANVMSGHNIIQTHKSPYPANNVIRRNEPVATDTVFASCKAIDTGGQTMAQIFIGRKSLVADVYGMGSSAEFVNTLEDVIRQRGAMDKLISGSAKVLISERVKDILRALCIDDWQSEPEYQHQNFAEHRWHHIQRLLNWHMNYRNVDGEAWLLCLKWICDAMNHTAEDSLGGRPPLQVLTGETIDISILLIFLFWDVVCVKRYKDRHYSGQIGGDATNEIRGRFVGFAWNVGHALTFKILCDDTKKVIHRPQVRLANDNENNLKLDTQAGAVPERIYAQSKRNHPGPEHPSNRLPTIDITKSPFTTEPEDPTNTTIPAKGEPPPTETEAIIPEKGEPPPHTTEANTPNQGEQDNDSTASDLPDLLPPEFQQNDDYSSDEEDDYVPRKRSKRSRRQRRTGMAPTQEAPASALDQGEKSGLSDLRTDEEQPDWSPMDDPPLKNIPIVETINEEGYIEGLPEEARPRIPGQSVVDNKPAHLHSNDMDTPNPTVTGLPPEEMIDRTFLMPAEQDGTRHRAKIIELVNEHKKGLEDHPELVRFRCKVNDDYEEIVAYNDIVDYIEEDRTWEGVWKFREILDHSPKLTAKSKLCKKYGGYKGSSVNVLVEWETGDRTWEPLWAKNEKGEQVGIAHADPATVAIYADKHNLIGEPGWNDKLIRRFAKTQKRLIRRSQQAKLHSFRTRPVYQYGFQAPRNHAQAMELDEKNGNTRWRDAEIKECGCMDEYSVFIDKGKGYHPQGYKKIRAHMVYAVKHDGRHRARLVAGGHLTDTPLESIYSSVVSLRGVRILACIAELNDLELWGTDISSAHLESYTQEKVYIIAGPEFGDLEGHTLIISKALYGLKSSGLRWHNRFSDALRAMGFTPSKAEQDIWMREKDGLYEYIAVYVDDLLIASKNPQGIIDELTKEHKFNLKGTGGVSFHLGCDFFRDEHGVLCYAPRQYLEKILGNYERLFGTKPKPATSPLTKGDHPELDTTALLNEEETQKYQPLIGALQWIIQIGRFDIQTAVMTLSRFRAAPRVGHMDRVKRIHGCLAKMRHAIIRIRMDEPDYSHIPEKHYDWEYSCYAGAKEEIPLDIPTPLGKRVVTTSFFGANLYHDLISGRSVSGILHLINKTPVDWYSKLQSTVETATFGSEYVAGRICVDQVIDIRTTLRYLGAPVHGPTFVFGDNETVVNTGSVPHAKLQKRHNALAYHRVRWAHAAKIIRLHHIPSKENPADILSKHWDYPSVWDTLKALMFWAGDTADIVRRKD